MISIEEEEKIKKLAPVHEITAKSKIVPFFQELVEELKNPEYHKKPSKEESNKKEGGEEIKFLEQQEKPNEKEDDKEKIGSREFQHKEILNKGEEKKTDLGEIQAEVEEANLQLNASKGKQEDDSADEGKKTIVEKVNNSIEVQIVEGEKPIIDGKANVKGTTFETKIPIISKVAEAEEEDISMKVKSQTGKGNKAMDEEMKHTTVEGNNLIIVKKTGNSLES